jgi:hypothetical protein
MPTLVMKKLIEWSCANAVVAPSSSNKLAITITHFDFIGSSFFVGSLMTRE